MQGEVVNRRYPIGAEVTPHGIHFRVWAPFCEQMDVVLDGRETFTMKHEGHGYFSLLVEEARVGMLYQFRLNGSSDLLPDPASRYQPEGPHGPSCIVDPSEFSWTDSEWRGITSPTGQSIYELHIGTFTQEGTWKAAIQKLPELVELGITIIEMMPIADFGGTYGWGYDGVDFYAPTRNYGTPDDLREFVNKAHALGLAVILDVVYNHFGPEGNYIERFSKDYFTDNYTTDWGKAINYEDVNAQHVRAFFINNALYWIEEFHFDGLRFDATQNIYDCSKPHFLAELTHYVREKVPYKQLYFISENEPQKVIQLKPYDEEGYAINAVWNDDFHHTVRARLTGRKEAYLKDYYGTVQEIVSSIKYGYLYQGQYYSWQEQNRGTSSLNQRYDQYVIYFENHDQTANSTRGFRMHQLCDQMLLRAMTTVLLLAPQTPLLFQGQEYGSLSPFHFFADYQPPLSRCIWEGRKHFLQQYSSFNHPVMANYYPDPCDKEVFLKCKLRWEEKQLPHHRELYYLHRDLLKLRKEDRVFTEPLKVDGAVLYSEIFLIRYFGPHGDDRLILVNLGIDFYRESFPEPLFAPPQGTHWKLIFCSEMPGYAGIGIPNVETMPTLFPGHCALVFKPHKIKGSQHE